MHATMHRQRKIVLGPKCYSFGPKLHVSGEERSDEQIGTSIGNSEADAIRSVQRERSAARLAANIEAARRIHSDEFQLSRHWARYCQKTSILVRWRPASSNTQYLCRCR
jgi:hypothetical protein